MPNQIEDVLSRNHLTLMGWVEHYCRRERNPELPFFETSERPLIRAEVKFHKLANRPGCYVVFTEAGNLKYVGMSWKCIGVRSVSHFDKRHTSPFWMKSTPPTYIVLIAVQKDWEAPSLEAYLTKKSAELRKIADADMSLGSGA